MNSSYILALGIVLFIMATHQEPPLESAYDHSVSPELSSYLHGPGKNEFITEYGLE